MKKIGTEPYFFAGKMGSVPIFYYIVSVFGLLGIGWAIQAFGETNLPPLKEPVRWVILGLYANLGLAYALLIDRAKRAGIRLQDWLWVALAGVFLCVMHPVFSGDLMEYLIRGRMLAIYHVSPYCAVPADFPDDILRPYSVWLTNPDSYGPLSVYIQTVPAFVVRHSIKGMVWMYKFIVLIFLAFGVRAFWDMLKSLALPKFQKHWAIFAFSPLLIVGALIDGHNDIMMMTFSIISVYYMFKKNYTTSFIYWTLGFLVKYMVVIILPFIIVVALKDEWKKLGKFPSAFVLKQIAINTSMIFLCYLPIWGGGDTFLAIWKQRGAFYTNSFPYAFQQALDFIGISASDNALRVFFFAVFALIYTLLLYRCWKHGLDKPVEFFRALAISYIAFYLSMPSPFGYWYLFWAFPWLVLSGFRKNFLIVLLYSALGLLAFYKRINYMVFIAVFIYMLSYTREILERVARK